jgi:nicotinamidase-related amidase|tara:strand:- start:401 stop:991 length:591 start_codon:yes stop_codon:yes gene_type:complete
MVKDIFSQIAEYNIRQASPTPFKTVLLVVDMQKYFGSIAEPILENVTSLIRGCREKGIKVLFTRHGHKSKINGSMMSKWWGDLIKYGTEEWELIDGIEVPPGDIIDKSRYSAFHRTDLDLRLQDAGVKDIVISGVMTNCCVETTARSAFDNDYGVFVVADACATVAKELHIATLRNLAYGFAYVVDTKMILDFLET